MTIHKRFINFLLVTLALGTSFIAVPGQKEKKASDSDTIITLERGACFGSCPIYKLTINGDGLVVFEGKDFVKQKGRAEARISRDQVKELTEAFYKIYYFSLQDRYATRKDGCPAVWTDNPTVVTSFKSNGKSKAISHYLGCREVSGDRTGAYPATLSTLEDKIDKIAGTDRWIK
jgi:hypothetical protein